MALVWVLCFRPRFVGAQSREPRPSAATMRRRPAQPADPVPPARAPQAVAEERSGRQLCQMRNCEKQLKGKVAARGRAVEPDKAGANSEELRGFFVRSFEQKGTNQAYPYCTHDAA